MLRSETESSRDTSYLDVATDRREFLRKGTLFMAGAAASSTWFARELVPSEPDQYGESDTSPSASRPHPQLKIGLITDIHHADKPPSGSRHYREAIPRLRKAVDALQREATDLLDGEGTIIIYYTESVFGGNGGYIEHGSVTLDRATLVIDGVVVPEPASFLLFGFGGLIKGCVEGIKS